MATYCVDNDLVKFRPNILSLGVSSWESQREEAYSIINRVIELRWYRLNAPLFGVDPKVTAFTPSSVQAGTLTRLEVFKTLELAYLYLMKDAPEPDGFERESKIWRDRYGEELDIVLSAGIDYDWDASGTIEDLEKQITGTRRLFRI